MGNKTKKLFKTALKFSITVLALYIVFSNISWEQVSKLLVNANPIYLLLAALFFIGSKLISAFRLQYFFRCIDLFISTRYNLKLYWIGMFYNLFLPGGIGGDGYKVYLLNKQYGTRIKSLIQASLIDRISGLVSLLLLGGVGFLFIDLSAFPEWIQLLDIIGLVLIIPGIYLLAWLLFRVFIREIPRAMGWSVIVQLLQVVSALLILMSLDIFDNQIAYAVLFLISSFVSILPFTIGGLGSREITFLIGFQYFGIAEAESIALSLLFTLITALVSLGGVFIRVKIPDQHMNQRA